MARIEPILALIEANLLNTDKILEAIDIVIAAKKLMPRPMIIPKYRARR
jgi:hypothetical protein